jgi:redox-sensitive bicupin YhaK (pirin superfamily)
MEVMNMMNVRRASERGHFKNDWLNSRHTFSFGEYYDPAHMGVSLLRVINDDQVAPGAGFATHPHRNMEIVSYVLSGALEHRDSMGNGSVIRPGDVQRMSAGSGVTHSEFNPSKDEPTHFLQIWLLPEKLNIEPGYEQKHFAPESRRDTLKLLVSPDGRNGSISANTDVLAYGSVLQDGDRVAYSATEGRMVYLHVASGSVEVNGKALNAGDGASLPGETPMEIRSADMGEVLLFDLPAEEEA